MYILGINFLGHNASACLIKDGQVIGAAEEDKFDRIKNSRRFPANSIKFCLSKAGITAGDVDHIAFSWNRWLYFKNRLILYPMKYYPHASNWFSYVSEDFLQYLFLPHYYLKKMGFSAKIYFVNHHSAHAASAFFVSPFEESAILTIDGMGEISSSELFLGKGNRISKFEGVNFPDSIGEVYLAVSHFLGFSNLEGPGKVMGLAAYGKPSFYDRFKKIIKFLPGGGYEVDTSYFNYPFWGNPLYSKKFTGLFGRPRGEDFPLSQRDKDIACSLQKITEEVILHLAGRLYEITRQKNICLAGGVALNGLANTEILRKTPFKKIFIQPAAGDAGLALGGAFYVYCQVKNNPRSFVMEHAYWGPSYSNREIKETLDLQGLKYKYHSDISSITAKLLAGGKVVGWFQGAAEWGPRALGNRSILADPGKAEMKDMINAKIKDREFFRPYAPSVLEEQYPLYFDSPVSSPFMLLVSKVKENRRKEILSVTHVDGTARMQTVRREINPLYWNLIDKFRQITGVPVILNTSFNRQEPIVCSPQDAVSCLLRSRVDYLAIGNYLVRGNSKKNIPFRGGGASTSLRIVRMFTRLFRFTLKVLYFPIFFPAFVICRLRKLCGIGE